MLLSDVCLTSDFCLSRLIGTEVAHVTRNSDTSFKVKWSKVILLLMS